jgi:hypothetical protein
MFSKSRGWCYIWSQFSAIFDNFRQNNWRFSQKPMLCSQFLQKLAVVWAKNANFSLNFSAKIFKNHNIGPCLKNCPHVLHVYTHVFHVHLPFPDSTSVPVGLCRNHGIQSCAQRYPWSQIPNLESIPWALAPTKMMLSYSLLMQKLNTKFPNGANLGSIYIGAYMYVKGYLHKTWFLGRTTQNRSLSM